MYSGTPALVIPEGAVILHVTVTDGMITPEPATVPAGEIYFIRSQRGYRFDRPFLESGTGPDGTAGHIFRGPLTDADVTKLKSGQFPNGSRLADQFALVPSGQPVPWPTPDEFGGHELPAAGRCAWWTVEVGDFPGRARFKDLVFFTVVEDRS